MVWSMTQSENVSSQNGIKTKGTHLINNKQTKKSENIVWWKQEVYFKLFLT